METQKEKGEHHSPGEDRRAKQAMASNRRTTPVSATGVEAATTPADAAKNPRKASAQRRKRRRTADLAGGLRTSPTRPPKGATSPPTPTASTGCRRRKGWRDEGLVNRVLRG